MQWILLRFNLINGFDHFLHANKYFYPEYNAEVSPTKMVTYFHLVNHLRVVVNQILTY